MKELNEEGLEVVDGKKVRVYEIKFNGSVLLTPSEAASMADGDLVTFIVTARNGAPKYDTVKTKGEYKGLYKRINSMRLERLVALDIDQAAKIYSDLGEFVEGVNEGIIETEYVLPEDEDVITFDPQEMII